MSLQKLKRRHHVWPISWATVPGTQYVVFAHAEFVSQIRYVGAGVGGFVTQYLFGLVRTALLLAVVASASGPVAGYTPDTLIAYAWATQTIVATVGLFAPLPLQQRLKDGAVATDMLRPINLQVQGLAETLGRATNHFLTRGLPVFCLGMWTCGGQWAWSVTTTLAAGTSMLLAIALGYALRFLVVCSGFWTVETRGVVAAHATIAGFLGGFMLPIHLFPGWLSQLCTWLPFGHVIQTPIDLLSGYTTGPAALWLLAQQTAWLVATLALGHFVLQRGLKKLEVQGG